MPKYSDQSHFKAMQQIGGGGDPKKAKEAKVSEVSRKMGIPERTLYRWIKESHIPMKDIAARKHLRGRKPKLTKAQQKAIADWVLARHNVHTATSGNDIAGEIYDTTKTLVDAGYVSALMKRHNIRSKRTQKRPARRCTPEYKVDVQLFREQYGAHQLPNVIAMDEAGIWDDAVTLRSYAPMGGNGTSVKCKENGKRDTIVATLCGNGTKLPLFYLEHKRQVSRNKVIVKRAVKGMTEEIMLTYIDTILAPNVARGTILLMDQLSSHMTQRVKNKLATLGIIPVYFPPKTAADLSPLDNCFFALFKQNFKRRDRSTPALKQQAALDAYAAVGEDSVLGCWRKCGLLYSPEVVIVPMEDDSDEEDIVNQNEFPEDSDGDEDRYEM